MITIMCAKFFPPKVATLTLLLELLPTLVLSLKHNFYYLEDLKMKNPIPIKQLVNWYFGNYCTRKCYDDLKTQRLHLEKLQEFANKLEGVKITHKEFLAMLRNDKTICNLSDEDWKKKRFSWKRADCHICKKLGVR